MIGSPLVTFCFYGLARSADHAGPRAARLLLPYLAWVAFAGALSFAVWRRNLGSL